MTPSTPATGRSRPAINSMLPLASAERVQDGSSRKRKRQGLPAVTGDEQRYQAQASDRHAAPAHRQKVSRACDTCKAYVFPRSLRHGGGLTRADGDPSVRVRSPASGAAGSPLHATIQLFTRGANRLLRLAIRPCRLLQKDMDPLNNCRIMSDCRTQESQILLLRLRLSTTQPGRRGAYRLIQDPLQLNLLRCSHGHRPS